MPTLDQWQYVQCSIRGVVISGILGNDERHHLNGGRIYTTTLVSVGIRNASPVAVTKSGTAYRLLDQAPLPDYPTARQAPSEVKTSDDIWRSLVRAM